LQGKKRKGLAKKVSLKKGGRVAFGASPISSRKKKKEKRAIKKERKEWTRPEISESNKQLIIIKELSFQKVRSRWEKKKKKKTVLVADGEDRGGATRKKSTFCRGKRRTEEGEGTQESHGGKKKEKKSIGGRGKGPAFTSPFRPSFWKAAGGEGMENMKHGGIGRGGCMEKAGTLHASNGRTFPMEKKKKTYFLEVVGKAPGKD